MVTYSTGSVERFFMLVVLVVLVVLSESSRTNGGMGIYRTCTYFLNSRVIDT
ncbi:MAG: hypothetical protein ACJA13_001541 [Paraglaciecola sp.]|jgi:hypothetical protein